MEPEDPSSRVDGARGMVSFLISCYNHLHFMRCSGSRNIHSFIQFSYELAAIASGRAARRGRGTGAGGRPTGHAAPRPRGSAPGRPDPRVLPACRLLGGRPRSGSARRRAPEPAIPLNLWSVPSVVCVPAKTQTGNRVFPPASRGPAGGTCCYSACATPSPPLVRRQSEVDRRAVAWSGVDLLCTGSAPG